MKCLGNARRDSGAPGSTLHPKHEEEQHAAGLLTFLKFFEGLAEVFLRAKTSRQQLADWGNKNASHLGVLHVFLATLWPWECASVFCL